MGRSAFSAASGAAALLTVLLAGCGPSTYGTGEVPEFAILREVTGGLGAPKKKPIEYQPRAPLVMPPSAAQLPAPVEPAAETADVQWPAQSDGPGGSRFGSEKPAEDVTPDDYRRLKPLAGLRSNSKWETVTDNHKPAYDVIGKNSQRKEFKAALDEAKGVGRTGRRYLTDPPEALREPAATAPAEFEDIEGENKGFFAGLFGG